MDSLNIFALILTTGLIASLNPASISVYCALLAGLRGKNHTKIKVGLSSAFYLLFYFLLVFIIGFALLAILSAINFKNLTIFSLVSAILTIVTGIIFIRFYFWPGKKINNLKIVRGLHARTMKQNHMLSSSVLGAKSALATLPSNGGILLCLTSILVITGTINTFAYMLLFAFCLITPLFLIFLTVHSGIKITAFLKWKEANKGVMFLTLGLVNLLLAWVVLLILNGTIGLI